MRPLRRFPVFPVVLAALAAIATTAAAHRSLAPVARPGDPARGAAPVLGVYATRSDVVGGRRVRVAGPDTTGPRLSA